MKMKFTYKFLSILNIIFIVFYITSCASTSEKASLVGTEGNECYENNTCNTGFVCQNDICVTESESNWTG